MENEKIDVRTQQLQMAQNMGISKEGLDFLASIEDWKKRELYYFCLVDGLSADQLRINEKKGVSIDWIKKLRLDYWCGKALERESISPIGRDVERLKSEVKTVCQESKELRKTLEENLEKSLRQQMETQKEAMYAKSQLIEVLEENNKTLSRQVAEQEQEIENLNQQLKKELRDTPTQKVLVEEEKTEQISISAQIKKKRIRSSRLQDIIKTISTKKFINDYIKSEQLTPEQKSFLLDCLEEGLDVRDIERIAVPGLEIGMMERLKKLQFHKGGS